jgi:hypothetical protein
MRAALDFAPPPCVVDIPLHGFFDGLFKAVAALPTQDLDLAAIQGVTPVVAGPVGDWLDQTSGLSSTETAAPCRCWGFNPVPRL